MKILLHVFLLATILIAQNDLSNLHYDALVVDMHADALYRYMKTGESFENEPKAQVDLPRLKKGGVDVQFFAVWPSPKISRGVFAQSVEMIDTLEQVLNRNPQKIELALNPTDIKRISKNGKIAACIGLEGGTAIENDLDKLLYFYKRGVRYLGLTWNNSPEWASSAQDENKKKWSGEKGLNAFGESVIKKMNDLGMIVDVSHAGEQTFYDVLKVTTKPVIASHSSVFSICPHYRNLKDEQIKALAQNGGVVFINFYPGYLVKDFDDIYSSARKEANAIQDSLETLGQKENFNRPAFISGKVDSLYPSVKTVVDHMEYVIKLVGADHVGIGSDFDGISLTPTGLNDVSKMPAIAAELMERGYSEKDIRKILGENFMRVFKSVTE